MIDFKEDRIGLHMSQSELSRKARIPRHRVGAAERGDSQLTPGEAAQVLRALQREAARMRPFVQKLCAGEELHG